MLATRNGIESFFYISILLTQEIVLTTYTKIEPKQIQITNVEFELNNSF